MVNRDTGEVKAMKIPSAEKEYLLLKVRLNVKEGSTIITDAYHAYKELKTQYNHKSVKHCAGEYVRTEARTSFKVHTNGIEGFWSQVKRGIYGIYHWASKKHINRYLNEFTFRYNERERSDFDKFSNWFYGCVGKRLMYANLIK